MDPGLWGPHVWGAIHLIALGSPEKFDSASASGYKVFIQNLPYVIPCNTCREHFLEYIAKNPPAFMGRQELFKWTVDFHNAVNVRLGKPIVDLETARKHWISTKATPAPALERKKEWLVFVGLSIIILGIYLSVKWRN